MPVRAHASPQPMTDGDLAARERELEMARLRGRWLSDDEQALLEAQQRERELTLARQQRQRHKLMVLLVVCVLIPPLWPLALALTLYLLFPDTTRRLALAAGVGLLALGILFTALVTALIVAVLMVVF